MSIYLKCIPKEYYESIDKINYLNLKERGFKALIFDLDNTLIDYNVKIIPNEIIDFLKNLENDFEIYILSNSREKRVKKAVSNHFKYYSFAKKPLKSGFKKVLKNGYKKSEYVMIGDQLVTDILGGNRIGIHTILIDPLDKNTEKNSTKINRRIEKFIVKKIMKKVPLEKREVLLDYVKKYY
ncbi:MAG: YqeG family HAD IIIA-type phosphatase [Acholeplasmataceae bacterium]